MIKLPLNIKNREKNLTKRIMFSGLFYKQNKHSHESLSPDQFALQEQKTAAELW